MSPVVAHTDRSTAAASHGGAANAEGPPSDRRGGGGRRHWAEGGALLGAEGDPPSPCHDLASGGQWLGVGWGPSRGGGGSLPPFQCIPGAGETSGPAATTRRAPPRYPRNWQRNPTDCVSPAPASMAFVTDGNRPQPLWQPPPTACLTAFGAASEAPSPSMRPCPAPNCRRTTKTIEEEWVPRPCGPPCARNAPSKRGITAWTTAPQATHACVCALDFPLFTCVERKAPKRGRGSADVTRGRGGLRPGPRDHRRPGHGSVQWAQPLPPPPPEGHPRGASAALGGWAPLIAPPPPPRPRRCLWAPAVAQSLAKAVQRTGARLAGVAGALRPPNNDGTPPGQVTGTGCCGGGRYPRRRAVWGSWVMAHGAW